MIEKILNHKELARENLISQYKQAENLIAILDAFNSQTQDLEDAIYSLFEGRWVDVAEGRVLDDFGTLVGQERLGFNDTFYRILIYVKMGENISQGETERVIDIYKIITRATRAMLQEHFPAGMIILSNGEIDPVTADFVLKRLQAVVGAGIRIDQIGQFSPVNPFGFLGAPDAQGFGDLGDPLIGGEWAFLYDAQPRFAYGGTDGKTPSGNIAGFGTLDDHILGGKYSNVI